MDGTDILIFMNTSLGADVDWMADPCSMRTCPIQLSVRALRIPKEPPLSVADALPLFSGMIIRTHFGRSVLSLGKSQDDFAMARVGMHVTCHGAIARLQ